MSTVKKRAISVFLTSVIRGGPDQRLGGGVHGFEVHGQGDGVVTTHPQHLLPPHQDPVEPLLRVVQDLDVAHTTLLPLVQVSIPAVQLGALLKQNLLILLSRLGLHLEHTANHRDYYRADAIQLLYLSLNSSRGQ